MLINLPLFSLVNLSFINLIYRAPGSEPKLGRGKQFFLSYIRGMPGPLGPLEKWWEGCCCWCGSCSVPKSGMTLCNPMDYSTPESPVLHYLLVKVKVSVAQSYPALCNRMDLRGPPGSSAMWASLCLWTREGVPAFTGLTGQEGC